MSINSESTKYQVITSGMKKEVLHFQWKIANFELISKHKSLIESQKFEFVAGESIDQKMLWEVSLINHEEEKESWIGIFCKIVDSFVLSNHGWADLCVQIQTEAGTGLHKTLSGMCEFADGRGWGWEKFFPYQSCDKLPLIDGALVLHVQFTALSLQPTEISDLGCNFDVNSKGVVSCSENQLRLLTDTFEDLNLSDVTIVTRDGKEFKCHKNILSAQCPVFATLFRSKMTESSSGKIQIDDISGSVMDILLQFFYSGQLMREWANPGNVVEFTYAAGKYQNQELLQLLDESLGNVCTKATAVKLLALVTKIGLEKAEKAILERVKDMTTSITTTEEFFIMTQI